MGTPQLGKFFRDRAGNFGILAALLAVPLILASGGALDIARHETIRARLQNNLDRGVLAAASLSQSVGAKETIESYLAAADWPGEIELTVDVTESVNSKTVAATAHLSLKTAFLQLAGISSLNVPAFSSAQERRPNIELSLVLDISGSMADNAGMTQLKPAAKEFVDTMLKPDMRPVTSINLVPFAGSVNIGRQVFDFLTGPYYASDPLVSAHYTKRHNKSHCFELLESDFAGGSIPNFRDRDQVPHFTYYNYESKTKQPWWCPTEEASISYFSNDPNVLKGKIDAFHPFDGTGTAYAMKWAAMLLDPVVRPYIQTGALYGAVPPGFASRPADFEDQDTMKFVVLMTDGGIGPQYRPENITTNEEYQPASYMQKHHREYFKGKVQGQYESVCNYLKSKGVTIFTIAFKIGNQGTANALAKCASSADKAYKVDGLQMNEAFRSIATTIQKIKLIG